MEKLARTLLVLMGDERTRELVVFLLEREGYRVFATSTPSSVSRILEEHPEVDLLFADLCQPDALDFAAIAGQARKLRPDLRILYTTGLTGTMRTMRGAELAPGAAGPVALLLTIIKAGLMLRAGRIVPL